jgi:hypothetical protein
MIKTTILSLVALTAIYPIALIIQHGLEPELWPAGISSWSAILRELDIMSIAVA